jgi:hypothetical protein
LAPHEVAVHRSMHIVPGSPGHTQGPEAPDGTQSRPVPQLSSVLQARGGMKQVPHPAGW